jgi:hypothetical protein
MDISSGGNAAVSIPVETGVRDFAFSSDGSALAVIDYHGDILMWALNSDPTFAEFYKTSRITAKLTVPKPTMTFDCPPHWNPCSVRFLDLKDGQPFTPLLLVGCNYNRRLHTFEITEGVVLQEIVFPSEKSLDMPPQNFTMVYSKEKQILSVGDTISSSIFFMHLDSQPVSAGIAASQSEYLKNVAERKAIQSSAVSPFPLFDYVTELPFFPKHALQTLDVTQSPDAYLDVFVAHSNGFSMLVPTREDLLPTNYKDAQTVMARNLATCHLHRKIDVGPSPVVSRSPKSQPLSDEPSRSRERSPRTPKQNSVDAFQTSLQKVEKIPSTSQISEKESTTPELAKVIPDMRPVSPVIRLPAPCESAVETPIPDDVPSSKELDVFITRALQEHCTQTSRPC